MTKAVTPKAERRQLARAELLVLLACLAGDHERAFEGDMPGILPVDDWPPTDPEVRIMHRYDLTKADMAKVWRKIADGLESQADRAGYDRTWDALEDGSLAVFHDDCTTP